ncbi:MAG: hypothetical protein FRX49_07366 [Trebouxia sp. A1-2]|nr:MAG: hypothetical protein FRX49_07366 [Trebouxia sp. A1-2]
MSQGHAGWDGMGWDGIGRMGREGGEGMGGMDWDWVDGMGWGGVGGGGGVVVAGGWEWVEMELGWEQMECIVPKGTWL